MIWIALKFVPDGFQSVSIGSGNELADLGNKPLPGPMLTRTSDAI